jgi:3,4-dihydroxy-2-butanone 4-phosphate synthase
MTSNAIQEIIADIKSGRMAVLMDDEERENEGDLLMAAEYFVAFSLIAANMVVLVSCIFYGGLAHRAVQ